MISPSMPLLRFTLHLLLGFALLLQAGTATAIKNGDRSRAAASEAPAATHEAWLPPCHATQAGSDAPSAPGDCCDASALGQLCQWACAHALSLTNPVLAIIGIPRTTGRTLGQPPGAPSWSPATPLRPPIG